MAKSRRPGRLPAQRPRLPPATLNMLLFKKKFLPAIRSGEKTQTIRLWKRRLMRAGQRSYIPGVGPVAIESVELVGVDDLTDADAIPDGFPSAAALRHELQSIYGAQLAAGSQAYRVKFRLDGPAGLSGDRPADAARSG